MNNWTKEIMHYDEGWPVAAPIFTVFSPMGLFLQNIYTLSAMSTNQTRAGTTGAEAGVDLSGYGLRMSNVSSYCVMNTTTGQLCDSSYSVGSSWGILFGLYLLYSILAVYLDNVLPDEMGMRKPLHYFCLPSYWGFGDKPPIKQTPAEVIESSEDADVLEEEELMARRTGMPMSEESAIEIRGLLKTFKRNGRPYHAVKCPQYAINKRSLFALLGPNGAGKTTTVNLLTGALPATGGEALVHGESIMHPGGMAQIRSVMGYCPQFDMLWDVLTAEEHLHLFATLKDVPAGSENIEAQRRLEQVRLADVAKSPAGSFSGGMKRRLSVSISLIGDPRVVFLDEPTTGMDPISRRHVWDVIEEAKQDRAIILTTHSMEEADILGDRIGIMAKGRLRCLGSSVHLKSKFGAGYSLTITTQPDADVAAIKTLVKDTTGQEALEEDTTRIVFAFKHEDEQRMPELFALLEGQESSLGIEDIQVAMSSLEDVFLDVIKKADAEEDANRLVTVTLPSGLQVQIVSGTEEPIQTEQGHFKVTWGLDDNGHMTAIDVVQVPSGNVQITMKVTVPEGLEPDETGQRRVSVKTSSETTAVVIVPDGLGPGDVFEAPVEVAGVGADTTGLSGHSGSDFIQTEVELDRRIEKLSTSYLSQSAAMMTKTVNIQKKRCCSNVCTCLCPLVSIALCLVLQATVVELLLFPNGMVAQRCTYCGPNDAWGKTYCEGKDCAEYFFPDDSKDKLRTCSADNSPFKDRKRGWMKDFNSHIKDPAQKISFANIPSCDESKCTSPDGDGGNDCWADGTKEPHSCEEEYEVEFTGECRREYCEYTCCPRGMELPTPGKMAKAGFESFQNEDQFPWMKSTSFESIDSDNDSLISFDEWFQYAVQKEIEIRGCEYGCDTCLPTAREQCRRIGETCGGNGNIKCFWPNAVFRDGGGKLRTGANAACFGFSFDTDALGYATNISSYKSPKPLPLQHAPPVEHISATPVVFSAENTATATKILDRMHEQPFQEIPNALRAAKQELRDAMWSLLMLPRLGCGQVLVNSGANLTNHTFVATGASSKLSSLLNVTVQGAVCKLLQHGEEGAVPCCLDMSASGQEKMKSMLSSLFDAPFALNMLSTLAMYSLQDASRCVQPDYGPELRARLPDDKVFSLAEGMSILAQVFDLGLNAVHPQFEKEPIPECSTKGTCNTPNGAWASVCRAFLSDQVTPSPLFGTVKSEPEDMGALPYYECGSPGAVSCTQAFMPVLSNLIGKRKCSTDTRNTGSNSSLWQTERTLCQQNNPNALNSGQCRVVEVQGTNGESMVDVTASDFSDCNEGDNVLKTHENHAFPPCLCMFQVFVERLSNLGMGPIMRSSRGSNLPLSYQGPRVAALPDPFFGAFTRNLTLSAALSAALQRVKTDGKLMVPFGILSAQLASAYFGNPIISTGEVGSEWGVATYDWIEYDKTFRPLNLEESAWGQQYAVEHVPCTCQNEGVQCQPSDWEDQECKCTRNDEFEILWNNCSNNPSSQQVCFSKKPGQGGEECMDEPKREIDKRERLWDLKLLARDCTAKDLRGTVQLLHVLMNSTDRRFDCVTMRRKKVESRASVDDEIYAGFADSPQHTSTVQGVVHAFDFKDSKDDTLRMTLMHNTSGVTDDFFGVQVNWRPWPSRLLTTLNQVLRAFVAERTQTTPLEMSPLLLGLKSFPVAPPWGGPLDLGSEMGPFLFSITFILIFPGIVTMLVEEKQARIRIMMRMMGLGTSAYWSITFAFWFLVYIVFALVFMMLVNLVALPSGYKIGMFANVLPGVQFIFFMLYATVTISFAFLWANLTTRLRTAQVSTILWVVMTTVLPFILDSIGQIFTSTGFPQGFLTFLSLFPPFALFRGLTFFRAFKVCMPSHACICPCMRSDFESHPLAACHAFQSF